MPASDPNQHHNVSPAEDEALLCVAKGLRNAEAAKKPYVSVDALRTRVFRFGNRTGMNSVEVRIWASKHRVCCLKKDG